MDKIYIGIKNHRKANYECNPTEYIKEALKDNCKFISYGVHWRRSIEMSDKIIVVGGGASGMVAAIAAKRSGSDVTLLERNDRVGKKLLTTGNGRCNYTNLNLNINNYHGQNKSFAEYALNSFNVDKTIEFFEGMGITPAEESGKLYPLSFQSSSVLDVLRYEMSNIGIEVITEAFVSNIKKKSDFIITLKDGRCFKAKKVIVAAGGMAMPVSGSDGNGYSLAKEFGHSIVPVFPGLVQLKLEGDIFKQINGVKFVGTAGIYNKNSLIIEDKGDILFTDYGISGPPILQISRKAIQLMNNGLDIDLRISIIHTKSVEELREYLKIRFMKMPYKTLEEALIGLINKKLILPIIKKLQLDKAKKVTELDESSILKLADVLTSWQFKVIGNKGWGQAQVTAGGINTEEIDNSTMESKLVKGLYFTGEIIDIDGDCGGFNLQWAWSSGYLAGFNASVD